MPMQPGSPQAQMPPGEDALIRRIQELERVQREMLPSVAASFGPVVADLLALLSSVIVPAFGYVNGGPYAIPAGQANRITRASFTLTVPSGFTQALISATAGDTGNNSTAGYDYLNSYLNISTPGKTTYFANAPSATAPAGYSTGSTTHMAALYTGLSAGAVITVASQPYSYSGAWASSGANSTTVDATCLFLR